MPRCAALRRFIIIADVPLAIRYRLLLIITIHYAIFTTEYFPDWLPLAMPIIITACHCRCRLCSCRPPAAFKDAVREFSPRAIFHAINTPFLLHSLRHTFRRWLVITCAAG